MSIRSPQDLENLIKKESSLSEANERIKEEKAFVEHEKVTSLETEQIRTHTDNNNARQRYARNIFVYTCIVSIFVFYIVICAGLGALVYSDAVLITLITSTTANFFGFFLLVVRYYFNPKKST